MLNILFTSVGRRVELMRLFRDALQNLQLEARLLATDINPLAPALQLVDQAILVPRFDHPDFVSTIQGIVTDQKVDLVLPLIDPDIPILADHRESLSAADAKPYAVVDSVAAEIAGDKWKTFAFFREQGLATPQSWLADQIPPRHELTFPLFVKPRGGSAAKNTFRADNQEQLDFFCNYVANPIVQEFLTGPEITVDLACDAHGVVLATAARKRLAVRDGEVVQGVTVDVPQIVEDCKSVAHKLPARGPITVQCMMHQGTPHFLEINARLGGGIPLAVAAGVDIPAIVVAAFLRPEKMALCHNRQKNGLFITRFDDSFFLDQQTLNRVVSPVQSAKTAENNDII